MTRLLTALLALAGALAGGCRSDRPWVSRVEEPNLPPPPPERVMRGSADFRIRDDASRKEYLLYFYQDAAVKEELVVVTPYEAEDDKRPPRLATREEHDRAMRLFAQEWKSKGDEERVRYFNDLRERAVRRSAFQLDQQIVHARKAKRHLEEEKFSLEADLKSRKDTNTFSEGSDKFSLVPTATLEREIAVKDRDMAIAATQLAILEYKRSLLDAPPPTPRAR